MYIYIVIWYNCVFNRATNPFGWQPTPISTCSYPWQLEHGRRDTCAPFTKYFVLFVSNTCVHIGRPIPITGGRPSLSWRVFHCPYSSSDMEARIYWIHWLKACLFTAYVYCFPPVSLMSLSESVIEWLRQSVLRELVGRSSHSRNVGGTPFPAFRAVSLFFCRESM